MDTTVKDRILLHMLAFARRVGSPSRDVTQEGIAKAAGIRRSHVPRALKQLIGSGALAEGKGRVGGGRELKVYELTEKGVEEAKAIFEALASLPLVAVHGGTRREMTVGEACEAFSLRPVDVLREARGGVLNIEPGGGPSEAGDFVDRDEELRLLRAWFRSGAPLMVIYGGAGYGKTAVARRFIDVEGIRSQLWVDLKVGDTPSSVLRAVMSRSHTSRGSRDGADGSPEEAAREVAEAFRGPMLVFDGYEDLGERMLEFFRALVKEASARGRPKILLLARDTTPSYSRFYDRASVVGGHVEEMHLGGLDEASSKLLLRAPDIEEEAFKRIYLLTRGCPLYLELIRDEDARELRRRSRFTNPEIRLLIFSKDVRGKAG